MARMTYCIRSFLRNNSGVAAIEMAIAFPIVLWLVIGIIELGVIFHVSSLANYAANEAARQGKTGNLYGTSGSREQLTFNTVRTVLDPWIFDEGNLDISSKSYGSFNDLGSPGSVGTGSGGNIVIYTVTLQWHYFTPLFGWLMGGDVVPITARVLVKNEAF